MIPEPKKDVAVYLAGKPQNAGAMKEYNGPEKRESPRYRCEGQVEIFEEHSQLWSWARISNISMHGCHVETPIPYPIGTVLQLRIKANDLQVLAIGQVRVSNPARGMGISLTGMSERDQTTLKDLLQIVSHDPRR
jgi:hypothetical protein